MESGVSVFLGVPYAVPPFGANRMLPPQPVPAWEGERDATAYGPTVPKGDYPPQYAVLFPEVVIPGEDCLTAPDPGRWGQLALSLLPFAPTVDGSVLPAAPLASMAAGQGGNVPLLIGSNRDEARLFLVAASTIDLIDEPTLAAVATAYGLTGDDLAVYRAHRPGASAGAQGTGRGRGARGGGAGGGAGTGRGTRRVGI